MSPLRLAALLLALTTSAQPALAQDWERYFDEQLGFSIELPGRFEATSSADGRLQLSEIGGAAQLEVFGVRNPEGLSVAEFRTMMEAADPMRRITYRRAGGNWFVFSGYLENEREPTIFYAKFMLNASRTAVSAFEISYPATDKVRFDATVERIEDSLTSPR